LVTPAKRVFNIAIDTGAECGGAVKGIASIEDPTVIKKIRAHLNGTAHPAGGAGCHNAGPHHRMVEGKK